MGGATRVRCSACGWSRDFFLGSDGALFSTLESRRERLPEVHRAEILSLSQRCGPGEEESEERLYVCPSCRTFSAELWVRLSPGGKLEYCSKFYCAACGSQLIERAPHQVTRVPCPGCGKRRLRAECPEA